MLHHHLELIGIFLKPEATAGFLPGFCGPWSGSTCTQGQGHRMARMMSVPDPGGPPPASTSPTSGRPVSILSIELL